LLTLLKLGRSCARPARLAGQGWPDVRFYLTARQAHSERQLFLEFNITFLHWISPFGFIRYNLPALPPVKIQKSAKKSSDSSLRSEPSLSIDDFLGFLTRLDEPGREVFFSQYFSFFQKKSIALHG
jgi:hypothetical protein